MYASERRNSTIETPNTMSPSKQHVARPGGGQIVLIVEDDADIRLSIANLLLDEGYLVEEAPNGRPALGLLRASRKPLVVLLDLNMPGMDGKTLLQAISDDPFHNLAARHAFILLTARDQRTLPLDFATLLTRLGVTFIANPFDISDLLTAVAAAAARLPIT